MQSWFRRVATATAVGVLFALGAGNLFAQELIVLPVLVERVDYVIAIPPGVFQHKRASAAARFGEAGNIQPVPPPALAELGRSKQAIDDALLGIRRRIVNELSNFF